MTTLPRLTVCGSGMAGSAIAADCALKGLPVTLFELPDLAERLDPIRARGGLEVTAASETVSGRTGFAELAAVTTDPAAAAAWAEVIMLAVPAMYHGVFVDCLAPHLTNGQIVVFSTGYWAGLRFRDRLAADQTGVILVESNIMPYICNKSVPDVVHIGRYKRYFRMAAFPGERSAAAFNVLRHIYPQYALVPTILDTNIAAGGNPPIHATLTIPVAGLYFDRYKGGYFYQDATAPGARLVEAHDRERERLCRCLGCDTFETQLEFDRKSYLYDGKDIAEAVRRSEHTDWFATDKYLEQVIDEDLIYGFVPMVRLAESLGVEMPVTRAMVEIMGVFLQKDYWQRGLSLTDLGLAGRDAADVRRFVTTGR